MIEEQEAVKAAIEALQGNEVAASKIEEMYYELMILRIHNKRLEQLIDKQ